MSLYDRIKKQLKKEAEEEYERLRLEAEHMNSCWNLTRDYYEEIFSEELRRDITDAGIEVSFSSSTDERDKHRVWFYMKTGEVEFCEETEEEYEKKLNFSICVAENGRWLPEKDTMTYGAWGEEKLLECIQCAFVLVNPTPYWR